MEEVEWKYDRHQWELMSRCNKCGFQIFPHSTQSAYDWAEWAFRKCCTGGRSPESLRDERLPKKNRNNLRHITKVLYY